MLLMIFIPIIQSCGDDEVDLNSYIVGEWRSFKISVQLAQQNVEVEVEKAGLNSQAYCEMTFKKDGSCIMNSWETDSKGLSSWITEYASYTVKGNTVTLTDGTDVINLNFDSKQKTLYLRMSSEVEGYGNVTCFMYLRK